MTQSERDDGLGTLLAKLADERGFEGESYKQGCIRRRIAVRMRARGVHTYDEYASVLDTDPTEYERLLDALTINVTKFYRNAEMWRALADQFLPRLWERRHGQVRCWSAGCASGEEPYTLAILLLELARASRADGTRPTAVVDATDFDRTSLARAEDGTYRDTAFDEMPDPLVDRYFSADAPRRVTPEVRQLVRFRQHDLLRALPPAPPYDLIICRNVIIYFDRPTQQRLFAQFADALEPDGYLVLGKVETLFGDARNAFVLEDARERIYRKP